MVFLFYQQLQALCKQQGIKLPALVKELGLDAGVVGRWKKGEIPGDDTVRLLAKSLGAAPGALLGESAAATPEREKQAETDVRPDLITLMGSKKQTRAYTQQEVEAMASALRQLIHSDN